MANCRSGLHGRGFSIRPAPMDVRSQLHLPPARLLTTDCARTKGITISDNAQYPDIQSDKIGTNAARLRQSRGLAVHFRNDRGAVQLLPVYLATAMLLSTALAAGGAERVKILFDAPAGAETYCGLQPVTFGIPFERGKLKKANGLRVVDAQGKHVIAQFDVTAAWAPASDEVRWLLVDLLAPIQNGRAPECDPEFGPDVPKSRSEPARRPDPNDPMFAARQSALVDGQGRRLRQHAPELAEDGTMAGRSLCNPGIMSRSERPANAPGLSTFLATIPTSSTGWPLPMRSPRVRPILRPTPQRAGMGAGPPPVLQRPAVHRPHACPAETRPGFRFEGETRE
jgi:hypothetical protein